MTRFTEALFQRLMARVGGPRLSAEQYQGRDIITSFASDVSIPLIDPDRWTSGQQTNLGVGSGYRPDQPFLPQFFALCKTAARPWYMHDPRSQNSPWASYDLFMNDAYGTYAGAFCSRVSYCDFCVECEQCADCLGCIRLQNSIECVQCVDGNRLRFCDRCEDSFELIACRDCRDCHDCVGCVGLQHASYYWFNEPLTEAEYKQRIAALHDTDGSAIRAVCAQFLVHEQRYPISAGRQFETQDSVGDDLAFTARVSGVALGSCTDVRGSAGVALAERGEGLLFCQKIEDSRASLFCVEAHHVYGGICLEACANILLGELLIDCHDCIGCIGLRHTSYAILNHVYEPQVYEELARRIRDELKPILADPARWSELFPLEVSPFIYRRSLAATFFSPDTPEPIPLMTPLSVDEQRLYEVLRWPVPTEHASVRRARRYRVWGSLYLRPAICDHCGASVSARVRDGAYKIFCSSCFEEALVSASWHK